MKLHVLFVGKTTEAYLRTGIDEYFARLSNYIPATIETIQSSSAKQKEKIIEDESSRILSKLRAGDHVVALDEGGKEVSSRGLAELFQKWMIHNPGRVVFIVGGPYGLSSEIKSRTNQTLSLSKLTFTHQMVRLILLEQIYRAMTIIKNEGYHHD